MPTTSRRRAPFRALHHEYVATILCPMPLASIMALCTPDGKGRWMKGWKPEFLYRAEDSGIDTAFRTVVGGVESLWMVLDMDLEEGSIGYACITPGSHMGTEMIDGEAIDETSCWLTITTEMTALSPKGNAALKEQSSARYQAMVGAWGEAMLGLLSQSKPST